MTIRDLLTIAAFCLVYHVPAAWAQDSETVPMRDVESVVEQSVEDCKEANESADFGMASVADWCEIRSWSTLGKHYPDLATRALQAERRANERAGQLTELRKTLSRREERVDSTSTRIGEQSAELDRSVKKWWATALTGAALLVGGAIGYGVAQIK